MSMWTWLLHVDLTPSHHPQADKILAATAGRQWPYSRGSRCGIASGGASQQNNERKNGLHSRKVIFSQLKKLMVGAQSLPFWNGIFSVAVFVFWEGIHVLKLTLFPQSPYRFGKDVMDAEAEKTFVWGPWIDGADGPRVERMAKSSQDIVSLNGRNSGPFCSWELENLYKTPFGVGFCVYLNWLARFLSWRLFFWHMSHIYRIYRYTFYMFWQWMGSIYGFLVIFVMLFAPRLGKPWLEYTKRRTSTAGDWTI